MRPRAEGVFLNERAVPSIWMIKNIGRSSGILFVSRQREDF
jgi:hypothetical protein